MTYLFLIIEDYIFFIYSKMLGILRAFGHENKGYFSTKIQIVIFIFFE